MLVLVDGAVVLTPPEALGADGTCDCVVPEVTVEPSGAFVVVVVVVVVCCATVPDADGVVVVAEADVCGGVVVTCPDAAGVVVEAAAPMPDA